MSEPTATPEDSQRAETIGRNAWYALLTTVATGAFTAVLTIVLVRALGAADYGTFALGLSITGLVILITDAGTSGAGGRFVAEHHGDLGAIAGVLGMALPVRIASGAVGAIALILLAQPIANAYDAPELAGPLRLLSVALFGQTAFLFMRATFGALRRTSKSFVLVLAESAVEFTATVSLVAAGTGVMGAAGGRAIGYVFGALLGVVMIGRFLGRSPLLRTGPSPVGRRQFVGYASALMVVAVADTLARRLDPLLIGAFLGTTAVGIFTAPFTLLMVLGIAGPATAQAIGPRMARQARGGPLPTAAHHLALKYILILQMLGSVFLLVWADPLTDLILGSEFAESAEVLRALTPFAFLLGVSALLRVPITYAGEGRRRVPIAITALIVGVVLDLILIPRVGVVGAAIACDVSYALYVGWHLVLARRFFDIPLRPLGLTIARAGLAGLAAAGVLALAGTATLSAAEWVVGAVAATAVFLVALLASRELGVGELRGLGTRAFRFLRPG